MKTVVKRVIMEVELDGEEYLSSNRDEIIRQKITETENTSRTVLRGRRRGRTWSQSELNYLNESYGKLSISTMARFLKRTDSAVSSQLFLQRNPKILRTKRASKTIRRIRHLKKWSSAEIKFLKNNVSSMSYTELSNRKELRDRTSLTIGWKARELGIN